VAVGATSAVQNALRRAALGMLLLTNDMSTLMKSP